MVTKRNTNDMTNVNDLPAKITHWFNTVNLEDAELRNAINQATNQGNIVYEFFKKRPGYCFSPFQVWNFLKQLRPDMINNLTPITSIRRSMTTLTEAGLLVKTEYKIVEELGKPNYLWKLYEPELTPIQTKLEF